MEQTFRSVQLSYKNTPLTVREQVAFNESSAKQFMRSLKEILGIPEAMVLSTCNRTEIYYTAETSRCKEIVTLIQSTKHLDYDLEGYFHGLDDQKDAVEHLFRVSIGLEAQVVGDLQISNQVKQAYQWCVDEDMAGPYLHRLMHTIFFTNKKVVQETEFRDGAASVAYATVSLINDLIGDYQEPKVLVAGVGEIGEDAARNLKTYSKAAVTITNRTFSKAEELASELEFEVLPYEDFSDCFHEFDVVISSINVSEPVITKKSLQNVEILRHKFFIDLSVPRSIAPDVEEQTGILLYNVDDIHDKANAALERRKKAIPAVEKIIKDAILEFNTWAQEMEVSPTIQKLKNALEEIRKTELARHMKKIAPEQEEILEVVTKGMMQKIIKLPVLQLKAACKRGEAETLIDVLNDLFNLEQQSINK